MLKLLIPGDAISEQQEIKSNRIMKEFEYHVDWPLCVFL